MDAASMPRRGVLIGGPMAINAALFAAMTFYGVGGVSRFDSQTTLPNCTHVYSHAHAHAHRTRTRTPYTHMHTHTALAHALTPCRQSFRVVANVWWLAAARNRRYPWDRIAFAGFGDLCRGEQATAHLYAGCNRGTRQLSGHVDNGQAASTVYGTVFGTDFLVIACTKHPPAAVQSIHPPPFGDR